MPQLNRDILREIAYEIIEKDGGFKNMDNFMMAGREPFQLVLNICKKAKSLVIFKERISMKIPPIEHKRKFEPNIDGCAEYQKPALEAEISIKFKLFKPISDVLATSVTCLEIRSLSSAMIPILKSIDREMKEIYVTCGNLKAIRNACINIPSISGGVIMKYYDELKSFTFPCQKLTVVDAAFDDIYKEAMNSYPPYEVNKEMNYYNSYLHNIHDLTINGTFDENISKVKLEKFALFLSSNFPNLKVLHVNFLFKGSLLSWNWNDYTKAALFQCLPQGVKGCIIFKMVPVFFFEIDLIVTNSDIQKNGNEYYKIFPITETLSFKLIYGQ